MRLGMNSAFVSCQYSGSERGAKGFDSKTKKITESRTEGKGTERRGGVKHQNWNPLLSGFSLLDHFKAGWEVVRNGVFCISESG